VKYYTNKARQAGMTLIELTVVLLVLIGLAGLMIPYVSGFVEKTHDSTGASNIQSLNNAMIRYSVENYDSYPNKMDSLIQTDGIVYSKMMNPDETGMMSYLENFTLTADEAKSLTNVGITTIMQMDEALDNATFGNTAAEIPVAAGAKVAILRGAVLTSLSDIMGKATDSSGNYYVVLGVGDDSTITGKTVADVPVHFAGRGDMSAALKYNHFVSVFEVPKAGGHCDISNISAPFDAGSIAADDGTLGTPPTLITVAPTVYADCLAENGVVTPVASTDNSYVTEGVVWVAGGSKAKFVGTAMAMMMNNFEGLGGALNNYYKDQQ